MLNRGFFQSLYEVEHKSLIVMSIKIDNKTQISHYNCRNLRSIYWQQILTYGIENGINKEKKEVKIMLVEEINILKVKLEDQIKKNEPYNMIYKTSVLIDKLLVEYYKKYGSNGKF